MRPHHALSLAVTLVLSAMPMAGCAPPPSDAWSGYIEGDFVQVAASQSGLLATLPVRAGDTVAEGTVLFTLDATAEQAGADEALARLGAAQATARNTETGRRRDELAVTRAQLEQARAQAALARTEWQRQQALQAQDYVAVAAVDAARTALDQADARVAELQAALRAADLPARPAERDAAIAQAAAASAALTQSRWRLDQTVRNAPAAGLVDDTYFRVGEWVPAGQPVLSLLPTGQVKARFFVREDEVATLAPGQRVILHCDGCGAPVPARITHIASEAEYTPPVIYSNTQRARLVFRVEARPSAADATRLRPGLPVDVHRDG